MCLWTSQKHRNPRSYTTPLQRHSRYRHVERPFQHFNKNRGILARGHKSCFDFHRLEPKRISITKSTSVRPCLYLCCITPRFQFPVSAQGDIVVLGKTDSRSVLSLPKVAFQTVPVFVWLNIRSFPTSEGGT